MNFKNLNFTVQSSDDENCEELSDIHVKGTSESDQSVPLNNGSMTARSSAGVKETEPEIHDLEEGQARSSKRASNGNGSGSSSSASNVDQPQVLTVKISNL